MSPKPGPWTIRSLAHMGPPPIVVDVVVVRQLGHIIEAVALSGEPSDPGLLSASFDERRPVELLEQSCPTCGRLEIRQLWEGDLLMLSSRMQP